MQDYFLPIFLVVLGTLFLMMIIAIQRKQAKLDAARSKYYRRHYMQTGANAQPDQTPHGFQVLYERRTGDDRRINVDRRQNIRVGSDRRHNPGRRKEDLVWADKSTANTH